MFNRQNNIKIYRNYYKFFRSIQNMTFICNVYNNKTKIYHFIELIFFIREKLKVKIFKRKQFIFRLLINVQSFLLLFFVNVFELY